MKVLFAGGGSAGSWIVRGEQLGNALGATIAPHATVEQCKAHDLIVLVKKARAETLDAIKRSGVPVVFDVVDCYPQPACEEWTRAQAIAWMRERIAQIAPCAVVWPNRGMGADVGFDGPSMTLRHHARPGLATNPVNPIVRTIGYEGAAQYLGRWHRLLSEECERRGWRFVVNPASLAQLDIAVAFRDGQWASYCARNWKSAVKLENCFGSGTPFVGQLEKGYQEVACGAEYFVDSPKSLAMALDWLTPQANRIEVHKRLRKMAYPLAEAASDYKAFLECASKSC
jgi:hypothetical protein